MYDELILKLREDAEFLEISSKYNNTKNEFAERISQAADAIEKLSMRIHGDEAAIAGMKREIERMVVADKPRWIPVTERLPELNQEVLVYAVGKIDGFIGSSVFALSERFLFKFFPSSKGTEEWRSPWQYFMEDYEITHWMPLPEPPEDGET